MSISAYKHIASVGKYSRTILYSLWRPFVWQGEKTVGLRIPTADRLCGNDKYVSVTVFHNVADGGRYRRILLPFMCGKVYADNSLAVGTNPKLFPAVFKQGIAVAWIKHIAFCQQGITFHRLGINPENARICHYAHDFPIIQLNNVMNPTFLIHALERDQAEVVVLGHVALQAVGRTYP